MSQRKRVVSSVYCAIFSVLFSSIWMPFFFFQVIVLLNYGNHEFLFYSNNK